MFAICPPLSRYPQHSALLRGLDYTFGLSLLLWALSFPVQTCAANTNSSAWQPRMPPTRRASPVCEALQLSFITFPSIYVSQPRGKMASFTSASRNTSFAWWKRLSQDTWSWTESNCFTPHTEQAKQIPTALYSIIIKTYWLYVYLYCYILYHENILLYVHCYMLYHCIVYRKNVALIL